MNLIRDNVILYTPSCGEHIKTAAKKIVQLALEHDKPIAMKFSTVGLIANPDDSYLDIIEQYNKILKRRRK